MFQQGGFGPIPGQVHHFRTVESEEDRRYGLERFSKETRRLYAVMDRRLEMHAFFADEPSIADFAILGGRGGIRGTRSISPSFRTSSGGIKR